jgi:hypothetical protein
MHAGKTPRMRFSILLLALALFAVAAPFAVRPVASSADDVNPIVASISATQVQAGFGSGFSEMDTASCSSFLLIEFIAV